MTPNKASKKQMGEEEETKPRKPQKELGAAVTAQAGIHRSAVVSEGGRQVWLKCGKVVCRKVD